MAKKAPKLVFGNVLLSLCFRSLLAPLLDSHPVVGGSASVFRHDSSSTTNMNSNCRKVQMPVD